MARSALWRATMLVGVAGLLLIGPARAEDDGKKKPAAEGKKKPGTEEKKKKESKNEASSDSAGTDLSSHAAKEITDKPTGTVVPTAENLSDLKSRLDTMTGKMTALEAQLKQMNEARAGDWSHVYWGVAQLLVLILAAYCSLSAWRLQKRRFPRFEDEWARAYLNFDQIQEKLSALRDDVVRSSRVPQPETRGATSVAARPVNPSPRMAKGSLPPNSAARLFSEPPDDDGGRAVVLPLEEFNTARSPQPQLSYRAPEPPPPAPPPIDYRSEHLPAAWRQFFTSDNGRNKGSLEILTSTLRQRLQGALVRAELHPENKGVAVVTIEQRGGSQEIYGLPLHHGYRNIEGFFNVDSSSPESFGSIVDLLQSAQLDTSLGLVSPGTVRVVPPSASS